MGSLFAALHNTGSSMKVFERGIGVVQGNVANASTPGYARQIQSLEAMRFDLDHGLPGGVASGGTIDTRSEYSDGMVRLRSRSYGEADERTTQLKRIEGLFDIGANSGLNAAMARFFQSASALTISPNDTAARNVLLKRAEEVAGSINGLAEGLAAAKDPIGSALEEQVGKIESIASDIVAINRQFRLDFRAQSDPGLQSRLSNLLENLSEIVDVSVLRQEDGSATVYLGGQSLLVIGDRQYDITADAAGPQARILDSEGNDIAGIIGSGRVAALLELRNTTLPGLQSRMDRLAEGLADRVNSTLNSGVDINGSAPVQGLFTYDAALGSARTLKVTSLAPSELALADPLSPGGNAVALKLAELAKSPQVDGFTFSQYYGGMAADAGSALELADEDQRTQFSMLSQARALRDEMQGVDLNEEAMLLLQYQRAYEAAAKMIQTLDEMTQTVLTMIR